MFVIPNYTIEQIVGRSEEIDKIYHQIMGRKVKIIFLEGESGIGKTAIASRLIEMASAGAGALSERFTSAIFQSMYQESWETGLAQLAETMFGRIVALKASKEVLENQLLNHCQERNILVVLDNIEINQQEYLLRFAKNWLQIECNSVLVITSLTHLPLTESGVQHIKLSGLSGPYPLELLGDSLRQRFSDRELLEYTSNLRGIPLNLLYLRWQDPKSIANLKTTVDDLVAGTLDKIDSLENILSNITQSPTHFMALGLIRQLQFDETLLAYFWDKIVGGNSEAYIHHRENLITNRLLIPITTNQRTSFRISAEVHKNLPQALIRRIGGKKRLTIIHYLASEYYRKQFEQNETPAIDTLNAFVYHCFARGDLLKAYKYLFESDVLSRLQHLGRALQLQALLETFFEYESETALQLQEVLETFLDLDSDNRLTSLQYAKTLIEIAHTCSDLGQFNKCLVVAKKAENILDNIADAIDEPTRINLLRSIWYYSGVSYNNTGYSDECIKSYFKIVATSENRDPLGCLCLGYLAHDLRYRDIQGTLKYALTATKISREIMDPHLLAKNLCNLGETYTYIPMLDKANECFDEASKLCHNVPSGSTEQRELGRILKNWGAVALAQKDWSTALERLSEGKRISLSMGDQRRVISGNLYIGILYHQTKDYEKGDEHMLSCIRDTYSREDYRYLVPALLTYAKWKNPKFTDQLQDLKNCIGYEQLSEIILKVLKIERLEIYANFWRDCFWPVFYE